MLIFLTSNKVFSSLYRWRCAIKSCCLTLSSGALPARIFFLHHCHFPYIFPSSNTLNQMFIFAVARGEQSLVIFSHLFSCA